MQDISILLVDDRAENLSVLEAVLANLEVNLVRADSGQAALKYVLERDFAVILLDVHMQGLDGLETARIIKQRERSAHIPIIFITGVEIEAISAFQGYAVGAVDYLLKPIVPEALRAKVSTFIELFRKNQEVREQAAQLQSANEELKQQLETVRQLTQNISVQERISQERAMLLERERAAHARADKAQQRMAFLADASEILASSLDYESTLANVARLAVPRLADWCSVYIVQADGSVQQLAVEHKDPTKVAWIHALQHRYPPDPTASRGLYQVLRSGQPELTPDMPDSLLVAVAQDEEQLQILRELGFSSAMTVALIVRGGIMGAISFVYAESGQHYGSDDLQLAQELARHCALAVENARLYRQAHQEREQLDVTLRSIGDAIIATDAQGCVTLMNSIDEGLTGWQQSEVQGKPLTDIFKIVNEYTRQPVDNPVFKVIREGRIVGLANHTLLISKDGTETPIDDSGAPIRDVRGHIRGVVLVFRDITARKLAEETIQRQADLLEQTYDAIFVWEAGNKILYWYRGAEALYGWTRDQAAGQVAHELLTTQTPVPWPEIEAVLEKDGVWEGELEHVTRDGQRLIVESRQTLVRYGAERVVLESNRDITERKRTESALREAVEFHRRLEEQLTLLIETSNSILGSLELGTVLEAILGFANQLIVSDAYAVWRFVSVEEGWHILAAAGLSEAYQLSAVQDTGTGIPFEKPMVIPDTHTGEILAVRREAYDREGIRALLVIPLRMHSQIGGSIVFYQRQPRQYDVLEIRLAMAYANIVAAAIGSAELYQQAQSAIAARDEFLSVAAHELKTPVTSLRGLAQMLLRQVDKTGALNPDQAQHSLQIIDQQSVKLSRLVTQLLDVSRIHAGKLTLDLQPTNIVELVQTVVTNSQLNRERHTITIHAAASVMATVDPLRLEQVATNLVDNAVKYSPAGGPIDIRIFNADSQTFSIAIQDHGMGIAPEHRPFLFRRFYRAHSDAHLSGLGLGLYISQQIVEQHHGHIEAQFPAEGGTRFVLTLPLIPISTGEPA